MLLFLLLPFLHAVASTSLSTSSSVSLSSSRMLFVFLIFHNTCSRKPLHEYNFGKTNVVGKEDIGYIEALKQHGTDYEDANEEEEVYEYQHESDFRSGGLDAEVREACVYQIGCFFGKMQKGRLHFVQQRRQERVSSQVLSSSAKWQGCRDLPTFDKIFHKIQ